MYLDSISEQHEVVDREKMRNGLEPQKRTQSNLKHHKNVNVKKKIVVFFISVLCMDVYQNITHDSKAEDPKPIWPHPAFIV